MRVTHAVVFVTSLLAASPGALAETLLPAGFTWHAYVSGDGFATGMTHAAGIPSVSTLVVDRDGVLYLARTGRRYSSGEGEDVWPIYRVPPGGARLTPETESRYLHGPPLPNPQVAGIRGGHEILITTFDRDRKIGVLYVLRDGRAELFAGGTPPRGTPPLLRQPEGAAVDRAGRVYVADRSEGAVVKLDASGRVLDRRHVAVTRPRILAVDDEDRLWVGSDGPAAAPWLRGPGEIWRVGPNGEPTLVVRGATPAAMAVGPGGQLFVADRQAARVFIVAPDGRTWDFGRFTDNDAPRGLCFAPDTPATRSAGIAGDLFVVIIHRGAWPVNEVVRISGPFDRLGSGVLP